MTEIQEIEFEGRTYVWSHEPQSPKEPWTWTEANHFTTLPQQLVSRLNRHFVKEHAEKIAHMLEEAEQVPFVKLLKLMGAKEADIERVGLSSALEQIDAEYALRQKFEELPFPGHTPFNSPVMRDWFFSKSTEPTAVDLHVACIGNGPFEQTEFENFLRSRGIVCTEATAISGNLILGRDDWAEDEIDEFIDLHEGKRLRIFSQEMFLAFLALNSDPFDATPDVLAAFRAGHDGLKFVSDGWPGWVQTETFVRYDRRSSSRSQTPNYNVPQSPLPLLGYKVGQTGVDEEARRDALRQAFEDSLHAVETFEYMEQWGEPGTPRRLRRIAEHLASLIRTRSGNPKFSEAIKDWTSDLKWLKETFYHGHMEFSWPQTYVFAGKES